MFLKVKYVASNKYNPDLWGAIIDPFAEKYWKSDWTENQNFVENVRLGLVG